MENNIPAFPLHPEKSFGFNPDSEGMTLLDYFATAAMQGKLASGGSYDRFIELAIDSYEYANAMLEARKNYIN